ncbi:LysR substrate-binding domain-containing protein [Salinisphaera sp. SPP-AMP-43]|uniref:LysR substrate-binding domain-containing protein n=1 Tax=Salinisphaera sp. SPP-AMP-43 TaxID=3121288 RepID=UPI003C6E8AD2
MLVRLPRNALRAVVIAARRGGCKTAAAQLSVYGAGSRQVKRLEAALGFVLFDRDACRVPLNAGGRTLANRVDRHLERLAEAAAEAQCVDSEALSISVPPSFVQHWLMPRLADFDAGAAEIAIEASQSLIEPVWQNRRSRLAIRFGPAPAPSVNAQRLMGDRLFPVCAPSLLTNGPRLEQPGDLAAHTLLHVSWPPGDSNVSFPGWREWLDAAGAADVATPVQQRYLLFSLALDQAIAGRGVALVSQAVVADRLASGVLVAPFGARCKLVSPFDYWLIRPRRGALPALAHRFCDWLIAQAAAFDPGSDDYGGTRRS